MRTERRSGLKLQTCGAPENMPNEVATPPDGSTSTVGVTCIGYTVLDAVWAGQAADHSAGGTAANVAANLAWLGVDVSLFARIGRDVAGRILAADLRAAGVDVSGVVADPAVRTPVLIHDARSSRPRYLFTCPSCGNSAASYRPPTTGSALAAVPSSFVFFDRASAFAIEEARRASASGGKVMFEPNSLGRRQQCEAAIGLADIVKVSDDRPADLKALLEGAPRGQLQVCTAGENGLSWRFAGSSWHHSVAKRITAVDTSGAGDWTTAGIISVLATSRPWTVTQIEEALNVGQVLAARACEYIGARGMSYALAAADVLPMGVRHRVAARSAELPNPLKCSVCLDPDVTDRTEVLAAIGR